MSDPPELNPYWHGRAAADEEIAELRAKLVEAEREREDCINDKAAIRSNVFQLVRDKQFLEVKIANQRTENGLLLKQKASAESRLTAIRERVEPFVEDDGDVSTVLLEALLAVHELAKGTT